MEVCMSKQCSICKREFTEYGNDPDPFPGKIGTCCNDCDMRFVAPVRMLFGRGDGVGKLISLPLLTKIAELGASLIRAQAASRAIRLVKEKAET